MKRFIFILIAFLLLLGFSACETTYDAEDETYFYQYNRFTKKATITSLKLNEYKDTTYILPESLYNRYQINSIRSNKGRGCCQFDTGILCLGQELIEYNNYEFFECIGMDDEDELPIGVTIESYTITIVISRYINTVSFYSDNLAIIYSNYEQDEYVVKHYVLLNIVFEVNEYNKTYKAIDGKLVNK